MRDRFNEQLEELHIQLIQMGALCEDAISAAAETLLKNELSLAEKAKEAEREIDQKERDVEGRCLKLLLQQQPVAGDLRSISAALKMISDLERIGDQAADIAELAPYAAAAAPAEMRSIAAMARTACRMVTDSVDSFVRSDLTLARSVCAMDDELDALFEQEKREIIGLIAADRTRGELGLDLLMIAKYFERIGDHATNVAEWVEFSITGTHPSMN